MFVVMNRINVEPEKADGFEKVFSSTMQKTLGNIPGLLRSTLLRPGRPDQPWVSTMEFVDEAAFGAWMSSPAFQAAHRHAPRESESTDGNPVAGNNIETFTVITDITP